MGLFRAVDQVVEQDAEASLRVRIKVPYHSGEIVGAVQRLDHDAFEAEICSPHLLDQFGVVVALDEDATGKRHTRFCLDRHAA